MLSGESLANKDEPFLIKKALVNARKPEPKSDADHNFITRGFWSHYQEDDNEEVFSDKSDDKIPITIGEYKPYKFFIYGGNYPERIREALLKRGNWAEVTINLTYYFSSQKSHSVLKSATSYGGL